jgi:hypothetical protein
VLLLVLLLELLPLLLVLAAVTLPAALRLCSSTSAAVRGR